MVSITTGISAISGFAFSAESTAQPSIPGIMTSSVIASGRSDDTESLSGEEALHQIPHRRLVVDDQHGADTRRHALGGRRDNDRFLDRLGHLSRQANRELTTATGLTLDRDVAAHHAAEPP